MGTNTRHGDLVARATIVALLAVAGCSRAKPAFDCDRPGASCGAAVGAVCVDDRCAVPSAECPSGLAYADNAGDLAGTCVTEGAPPPIDGATGQFTVTVPGDELYLRPGASTTVSVTVSRQPGFTEAIDVTLDALPEGLTAEPIVIAAGETSGQLTLQAAASATPGTAASAQVTGRAEGFESASSLPVLVVGTPGTLDESFGTGGQVGDSFQAASLIVQPSGRIIVGGTFGKLIRYDQAGLIDESFGTAGIVEHDFSSLGGASSNGVVAIAQSDGRIVVVATLRAGMNDDIAMLRYDANGVLDPTFRWRHSFGDSSTLAEVVAIGPQDEIVVAGRLLLSAGDSDVFVARFLSSGEVDETFDGDGLAAWDLDNLDLTSDIAVQDDGKIVVLTGSTTGEQFAPLVRRMLRFRADGPLDGLFGASGVVAFSAPSPSLADVIVQEDGRITIAGAVNSGFTGGDQAVWRHTAQGQPDAGFGTDGLWAAAPTAVLDFMSAVIVAPDGSLYVGGAVNSDITTGDPLVVHLDASGTPSPDFGIGGTAMPLGVGVAIIRAALRPDHRLVMLGNGLTSFRVIRLWY